MQSSVTVCPSQPNGNGGLVVFQVNYVGAKGRNRTADTSIFSAVLYRLSYLGARLRHGNSVKGRPTGHSVPPAAKSCQ